MIFFVLFILAIVVQCIYALHFFVRIFAIPPNERISVGEAKGVSVIICARDEAENLILNLPHVLNQVYHGRFEVIVVNDNSCDETGKVLMKMKARYDNLSVVNILPGEERQLKGKKFALSKGVSVACYDWLLLTDADCFPASPHWLELMVAPLSNSKEIVAGYGGFYRAKGLLNAFTRWESMHTFLQYSTYTLAGRPYMAVGRNMACTKKVYVKAHQSEVWNKVPSGDDDLLVSICGSKDNTAIVSAQNAFTYSRTKTSWKEWVRQKQRHLSTGKYYKQPVKMLLGAYGISHALMWAFFFVVLFSGFWSFALVLMLIRCALFWWLWAITDLKLKEIGYTFYSLPFSFAFPFFDIGWLIYNFVFFPYIAFKNKNNWK